ncbi:hypothetical protein AAFF_G00199850 [Aldrovandia affinis]|uniref:CASAMP N-terminal domain-containing protein n=1 Tax=Aldrovandia affinis TaxID=143900 RepID=A0AAD7RHY0_9TELE|nr:hypothetical protein AAFF_G00199850 [Aldrovandia affinis]
MVDSTAMRKTFTVPEIKPLDQYDFNRAKICASLGWLLTKSYSTAENVPVDLREPFYSDQYEQEHIKPPITRLLLSSELYCRAYGVLLGPAPPEGPPRDGPTLLRHLAKRGAAPKDRDVPVTEADLRHKPIRMCESQATGVPPACGIVRCGGDAAVSAGGGMGPTCQDNFLGDGFEVMMSDAEPTRVSH